MMKTLLSAVALLASSLALAAGSTIPYDKAPIDLTDKASLQNGARLCLKPTIIRIKKH